jgi:hypothetical protein
MVTAFVIITLLFCIAAARDRARGHDVDGYVRLFAIAVFVFVVSQCSTR